MLDVIQSAARVGLAVSGVFADQTRAHLGGFPLRATDIDAHWLEQALDERHPGVEVGRARLLDDHSGTTSRARFGLEYLDPGEAAPPPPTLFLKLTPHAPIQRLFLATFGIGCNEVRFYRCVRPGLPVRAPGVHGLCALPGDRQFVLLLEDIAHEGVELASVGDRATVQHGEAVVDALAKLHAHFWESQRFHADLAWVPCYENRLRRSLPLERFVTGQMCDRTAARYASEFPPELARIAHTCKVHRDRLEQHWADGPRTLVHGDCHLGNLYFDEGDVGFLDWQVCTRAPGMRDVSYFLCNSLSEKLRRENERSLIERYLRGLEAQGVDAPDFDTAFRQHRLFALYSWIAAAFTVAAGDGMQPIEIGMAGLRRATTAAIELSSVDCALGAG